MLRNGKKFLFVGEGRSFKGHGKQGSLFGWIHYSILSN